MSFGFSVGDFVAVLELATKVRQKWIDAPVEYASLRAEVRNVENTLKTLVELVDQVEINIRHRCDLEDAKAHCTAILHRADEITRRYSSLQDNRTSLRGRAKRNWKRFKADPDDVRHLRDQLTATVTQLGAIQNNIEIRMTDVIEVISAMGIEETKLEECYILETAGPHDMVQEVSEDIDELHLNQEEEKKIRIADWFASSSFAEQQSDQLARRHAGTGAWFLQSQQYTNWRQGGSTTLFCPGIPGSGKTIIVATVIDDLRQNLGQQPDVIVAYFYCNFRRPSDQSLNKILAALTRQLFQERSDIPTSINELYKSHNDRNTKPSNAELKNCFRLLVQDYRKVFFVVDALDECVSDDRSRDGLLEEIFGLQMRTDCDVNLFATSRFVPEIINRFQGSPRKEIAAQQQDIEIYLNGRMLELCSGVRKNVDLQEEIKTTIAGKVDGMFLLARLHFESLTDKMTPRAIRKALEMLSKGSDALHAAYEEAMMRIHQQREGFRQMAQKVLAWIVFAKRELSVRELQEAVTVESGMRDIDPENDLIDADEMISVCAGLVTVDRERQIVRLVHYTTQEFFERTKEGWLPDGQVLVARSCIDYLCMEVLKPLPPQYADVGPPVVVDMRVYQEYRLLRYVGANWGFHACSLETVEEYIQSVLDDAKKLLFVNQMLIEQECLNDSPFRSSVSSLHICAYFDNAKATRFILDRGANVNQIDGHDHTALEWTAEYGSVSTAKELLAQPDIDVNLGAPLSSAATCDHKDLVELLLAQSAIDVNHGSPLRSAVMGDHEDIVKLLLAHPDIDVNRNSPLRWAMRYSCRKIIELLLTHPDLDVNTGRPLYWAIRHENRPIATLLLTHPNIDVNLGEPLRWAAAHGNQEMVKLLLAHPNVDVNLDRPLFCACSHGHEGVVELLLRHPAIDVNLGASLHIAAWNGHTEIARLLLAHPDIDVNLEDPLSWATKNEHQEIAELLRAHPDIQVQNTAISTVPENHQ